MVHHHILILAAGEGTRMRSSLPKVLHPVASWPMVRHVHNAATQLDDANISFVIGAGADLIKKAISAFAPEANFFEQKERLGTAHAVLSAREFLKDSNGVLLIVFGDTPLLKAETLHNLSNEIQNGASVAVLGFEANNPFGYGRIVVNNGMVEAIVEEKDASESIRKITLCNAGAMAIKASNALELLEKIDNKNAKNEYYLTDIVKIARAQNLKVAHVVGKASEAFGANNRVELAELELLFQVEKRETMMLAGVSLIAPETVYFAADTQIAQDVTIEPNVVFGEKVTIETGAIIHAFSHIEGAYVGKGASVGPFARLRPGTVMQEKSRIGNFVEVKNTQISKGAKANHLTYLGDAFVGENANIGAGTITCNYDGFNKFKTHIGAGAFIGSNSALVAPVSIQDGAIVGAGSTLTQDVPENAIAVARGELRVKEGAAIKFRDVKRKK